MQDTLQIVFYIFSGLAILSAGLAVTQSNPVRSVLFLVVTFLSSSVLWVLVEAEFLALILVLVYVGAVMTLFLFVVMMLNIDVESRKQKMIRYLPVGVLVIGLFVAAVISSIPSDMLSQSVQHFIETSTTLTEKNAMSNTASIGMVLYTDYVYAFEMAAVILLVAIIAAIMLVHRGPKLSKRQNIREQLMVERKDRLKLISMKTEQS